MNHVKHIRKVTSFLLLLVTALLLVACSKKENVPYGDLTDNPYISVGNVTITEKQLYDNLRRESQTLLGSIFEEKVFEDYQTEAKSLLNEVDPLEDTDAEKVQTLFDDNVSNKIFGTKDISVIQKLPEVNRKISIERFVNGVYQLNYNVNRDTLRDDINNALLNLQDEDFKPKFFNITVLRDLYLMDVQKFLYAKSKIAEDFLDEESTVYVKDTAVINYYKNEVKSHEDVKVFYFHFLNLNEANAALREVGVKASSTGHYYNVPDIRDYASYAAAMANDEDAVTSALKKAGLLDLFDGVNAGNFPLISSNSYKKFYDAYSVSDSSGDKLTKHEVLDKFVTMFNLVNKLDNGTNGLKVQVFDENTIFEDVVFEYTNDVEYETNKTHEDLTKLSSSFAKYIYEGLSSDKPYSTIRSVGTRRYLAFKLSPDHFELDYVSETKDDDNNEKWVTRAELEQLLNSDVEKVSNKTLYGIRNLLDDQTITKENVNWDDVMDAINENILSWNSVEKNRLTVSYTTRVVNELLGDAEIEIYDSVVRTYFNQAGDAKGKDKAGNIVAKISLDVLGTNKSFEVTVREFYNKLEANNGLELALDLVMNELLMAEYNKGANGIFKDYLDKVEVDKFKEEYSELIKNFSNDGFAQAGYPASLGREAFLLLIFGTKDKDKVIELGYIIPKLRELFFGNIELSFSHLNNPEEEVISALYNYTEKQYDNYRGVSVNHLLIYFDANGDGAPDNPKEYLENLTPVLQQEVKDEIIALHTEILDMIGDIANGLGNVKVTLDDYQAFFNNYFANKFDNSVRLDLSNLEVNPFKNAKKLGLNVKFENISSPITNSSNLPFNSSTLDKVFYDRAMALHDFIVAEKANQPEGEEILNGGIPHFDFGGSYNILDDLLDPNKGGLIDYLNEDGIMSDFGFHFILVDDILEKQSAKYEVSQDSATNPRFVFSDDNGKKYEIYNEDDKITLGQVEYYIIGKKYDADIPNSVQKAFSAFFNPVYNLYNNTNMKQAVFYKFINSYQTNFYGKDARYNTLIEVNETNFYNYMNKTNPNFEDFETQYNAWEALYAGWFEAFGLK